MAHRNDDDDGDMLEQLAAESRAVRHDDDSYDDLFESPAEPKPIEVVPRRRVGRPSGPEKLKRDAMIAAVAAAQEARTVQVQTEDTDDDMTKRGRQRNAMPGPVGRPPQNVREVPVANIQACMDQGVNDAGVVIKIYVRNARGHLAYLNQVTLSLEQLMDVETWLKNEYGGGRYRIDPRDLQSVAHPAELIPPFEIDISGPSRIRPDGSIAPLNAGGLQLPPAPGQGFGFGVGGPALVTPGMSGPAVVDSRLLPNFVRGMTPEQQMTYVQQNMPQAFAQPVMSMTPDALAVGELDKAQRTIERLERARENDRKANEAQLKEIAKQLEAQRQALADQQIKEQDRARQMEMAQLRDDMRRRDEQFKQMLDNERNKKPAFDLAGFAAVAGAIAPVVTAMITSNKDQAAKSLQVQAEGINNLMQATLSKADTKPILDVVLKIAPLAMPFITEWMKAKSPGAQADLVATMAENQLTSIGMMAKLVSDMMPESENAPPWLEMVQKVMGGLVGQAEAMMNSNKAAVGIKPPAPYAPPTPRLTPAQQAVGMQQAPMPQQPQIPVGAGAQIVQLMRDSPQVPNDLKTPEWLHLVERLHDRAPIEEVAKFFAEHVRTLDDNLPAVMTGFWDAGGAPKVMLNLFSNLPIWQWDQPYVQAFIDKAMDELTSEDEPRPPASAVASAPTMPSPPPVSAVDFFSTAG